MTLVLAGLERLLLATMLIVIVQQMQTVSN
jgi:hypothetical protein